MRRWKLTTPHSREGQRPRVSAPVHTLIPRPPANLPTLPLLSQHMYVIDARAGETSGDEGFKDQVVSPEERGGGPQQSWPSSECSSLWRFCHMQCQSVPGFLSPLLWTQVVQKVHHLCLLSNTLSLTPWSCFLCFWNFHDTDLPSSLLTQVMGFRSPVNRSPKGNRRWCGSKAGPEEGSRTRENAHHENTAPAHQAGAPAGGTEFPSATCVSSWLSEEAGGAPLGHSRPTAV